MLTFTRRDFLKRGAYLAALMGLESSSRHAVAEALQELSAGTAPVLWLQALSCTGCSISLLNSEDPVPAQFLTQMFSLKFHSTLSAATGQTGVDVIHKTVEAKGYYLLVEGSVPAAMPEACVMDHKPLSEWIVQAAQSAKAVIAVGTCASFGGIPAAESNPTAAESVPDLLNRHGIQTPVIRIPGCPCHPDWLIGTVVHLLKFGMPQLDEQNRPTLFFSKILHDQCPRYADYERENFARVLTDPGCLFYLGCLGPNTRSDCSLRHWNGYVNTCIQAGSPCQGCAWEGFAKKASLPFFTKGDEEFAARLKKG